MLADKIDVTAFFVWFIENYPESKKIILKQEPTFRELFSIVEAEKEKKALNEILTTTEKNKITIKRM